MKQDKRPLDCASPIEALRIERTKLSQAEFAVHCGIPLRTYQRWVSGETEAKPTPRQWKVMMRLLQIQSFDEVPDDFGPINSTGEKD
jgi:DNA-binding transcriptional regulator YiaG